jgi:hypothetical protein
MMKKNVTEVFIQERIFLIRGEKVMLDSHLAELYDVPTKSLNLAVRRNLDRFPQDFMFKLTQQEADALRFQIETSNKGRGGRRYLPHVFTEQGVAMLSSVLRSKRAVQVNIAIMRVFVKLRKIISMNKELAEKLKDLEQRVGEHDEEIKVIFQAIRQLTAVQEKPKQRIGFHT